MSSKTAHCSTLPALLPFTTSSVSTALPRGQSPVDWPVQSGEMQKVYHPGEVLIALHIISEMQDCSLILFLSPWNRFSSNLPPFNKIQRLKFPIALGWNYMPPIHQNLHVSAHGISWSHDSPWMHQWLARQEGKFGRISWKSNSCSFWQHMLPACP